MNKQTKKAIKHTFLLVMILITILIILSIIVNHSIDKRNNAMIPNAVLQYKPLIEKYAEEYGIANYVNVLLAMMMQEFGGRGTDPMQSSESYCGQIGCIDDPELSIMKGVYYFAQALKAANYDVELAVQSYNFGLGFIHYVNNSSGYYTLDIAIEFSQEMYENAEDPSIYSCLREEAKQYNACYGDIYYAQSVMNYVDKLEQQ